MTLEEAFKKREEEVKVYSQQRGDPVFAKYGVLIEKMSHLVMDYLHENSIDGNVDAGMIHGVYFAHCWSLARFIKIIDGITGAHTEGIAKETLDICLESENIDDKLIAIGKEGN